MSTTHHTTALPQTFAPIPSVGFFERFRIAFREWRERRRLLATLSGLSDWELLDIGTTRGEIDYVASHRETDPRGVYPPVAAKLPRAGIEQECFERTEQVSCLSQGLLQSLSKHQRLGKENPTDRLVAPEGQMRLPSSYLPSAAGLEAWMRTR